MSGTENKTLLAVPQIKASKSVLNYDFRLIIVDINKKSILRPTLACPRPCSNLRVQVCLIAFADESSRIEGELNDIERQNGQ